MAQRGTLSLRCCVPSRRSACAFTKPSCTRSSRMSPQRWRRGARASRLWNGGDGRGTRARARHGARGARPRQAGRAHDGARPVGEAAWHQLRASASRVARHGASRVARHGASWVARHGAAALQQPPCESGDRGEPSPLAPHARACGERSPLAPPPSNCCSPRADRAARTGGRQADGVVVGTRRRPCAAAAKPAAERRGALCP